MSTPRRLHYRAGEPLPEGAVLVCWASGWSNPYRSPEYGPEDAVQRHRDELLADQLYNLKGRRITRYGVRAALASKDLACTCEPGTPCHGDTLLSVANGTTLATPEQSSTT